MNSEEIIITKDKKPIPKSTSVIITKELPQLFGSAKNLITISDDFEAPLEDFKDYM